METFFVFHPDIGGLTGAYGVPAETPLTNEEVFLCDRIA